MSLSLRPTWHYRKLFKIQRKKHFKNQQHKSVDTEELESAVSDDDSVKVLGIQSDGELTTTNAKVNQFSAGVEDRLCTISILGEDTTSWREMESEWNEPCSQYCTGSTTARDVHSSKTDAFGDTPTTHISSPTKRSSFRRWRGKVGHKKQKHVLISTSVGTNEEDYTLPVYSRRADCYPNCCPNHMIQALNKKALEQPSMEELHRRRLDIYFSRHPPHPALFKICKTATATKFPNGLPSSSTSASSLVTNSNLADTSIALPLSSHSTTGDNTNDSHVPLRSFDESEECPSVVDSVQNSCAPPASPSILESATPLHQSHQFDDNSSVATLPPPSRRDHHDVVEILLPSDKDSVTKFGEIQKETTTQSVTELNSPSSYSRTTAVTSLSKPLKSERRSKVSQLVNHSNHSPNDVTSLTCVSSLPSDRHPQTEREGTITKCSMTQITPFSHLPSQMDDVDSLVTSRTTIRQKYNLPLPSRKSVMNVSNSITHVTRNTDQRVVHKEEVEEEDLVSSASTRVMSDMSLNDVTFDSPRLDAFEVQIQQHPITEISRKAFHLPNNMFSVASRTSLAAGDGNSSSFLDSPNVELSNSSSQQRPIYEVASFTSYGERSQSSQLKASTQRSLKKNPVRRYFYVEDVANVKRTLLHHPPYDVRVVTLAEQYGSEIQLVQLKSTSRSSQPQSLITVISPSWDIMKHLLNAIDQLFPKWKLLNQLLKGAR